MSDNLPSSAFGLIKLFPSNKDEINKFSNQIIRQVEQGEINPLQLKVYMKMMEKVIELVNEKTKANQLTEAEKYQQKEFELLGVKVEVTDVYTKYDYAHCKDPEWEMAERELNHWDKTKKDREAFLKALKKPEVILDQETGEMITVYPPIKKSTTGLKLTIK